MRRGGYPIALSLALALCSGCATKPIEPVSISQSGDDNLTCDQISSQIEDSKRSRAVYEAKQKDTDRNNTVAGIAGLVVGPYIASSAVDLSNGDQVKIRSINDRIEALEFLRQKKC